jgi:3-oxoacyl-[acyl-carrier protein] reductase
MNGNRIRSIIGCDPFAGTSLHCDVVSMDQRGGPPLRLTGPFHFNTLTGRNMTLPLQDKIALVTGASRGIGAAVAQRLAADGALVVVHFNVNEAAAQAVVQGICAAGQRAECVGADLSRLDGPAQLLEKLAGLHGGRCCEQLDVLVNNAGDFQYGKLTEASDQSFDHLFNLNVRSVFQLSRHAARLMSQAGWGRIINMGSVFGQAAPMAGLGLYCGTKFAVQGLTRAWSRDLGPQGVTVNSIQPALIQPEPLPTSGPAWEAMKRFVSVGRFGRAQEVAEMAAFLASPKAAFINGESFCVDGGWSA